MGTLPLVNWEKLCQGTIGSMSCLALVLSEAGCGKEEARNIGIRR